MSNEIKISELPAATTASFSDISPIVKDGTTKKLQLGQMIQHGYTTNITSSSYSIVDNDYFVGINYAGTQSTQIPAPTGSGRILIIKDTSGLAFANSITITPASGTIDGRSSLVINIGYGSYTLFDNAASKWSII